MGWHVLSVIIELLPIGVLVWIVLAVVIQEVGARMRGRAVPRAFSGAAAALVALALMVAKAVATFPPR